jgi:hypothetical protein
MSSHSASATSNTYAGNHMNEVTGPPANPASCRGRITTSSTDASMPSQASGTGIIRPRRRSRAKKVLPTAKKVAPDAPILRGDSAHNPSRGSCLFTGKPVTGKPEFDRDEGLSGWITSV